MPVDPEVQKLALKGYERGETPITVRPADVLKPELEAAREATKGIAKDIGDVLTYALYPQVGLRFLKWKYGLETPPADVKVRTLDDVKREDDLLAKARAGKLVEKGSEQAAAPAPAPVAPAGGLRHFNIHLDGRVYNVGVEPAVAGAAPVTYVPAPAPQTVAATPAAPPPVQAAPKPVEAPKPAEKPVARVEAKPVAGPEPAGEGVMAPMPGVVVRYEVEVGAKIKAGDTVVVLEAMKMAIDLPSPVDGTVAVLKFKAGDRVSRDDVLAIITS
jgi:pyruvate carboxylase subunit B